MKNYATRHFQVYNLLNICKNVFPTRCRLHNIFIICFLGIVLIQNLIKFFTSLESVKLKRRNISDIFFYF